MTFAVHGGPSHEGTVTTMTCCDGSLRASNTPHRVQRSAFSKVELWQGENQRGFGKDLLSDRGGGGQGMHITTLGELTDLDPHVKEQLYLLLVPLSAFPWSVISAPPSECALVGLSEYTNAAGDCAVVPRIKPARRQQQVSPPAQDKRSQFAALSARKGGLGTARRVT